MTLLRTSVRLTESEIKVLLVVLHGAMDDDDQGDQNYSDDLANANEKLRVALRRINQSKRRP